MREYKYEQFIRRYLDGETPVQICQGNEVSPADVRHMMRQGFHALGLGAVVPHELKAGCGHGADTCSLGPVTREGVRKAIKDAQEERREKWHRT